MDNELFWQVLEPVHPQAAAFCRKLTGDRDRGDDLYQEALLAAMRKFNKLREVSAFRPWLYRIMINIFKNQQRSFWRRRVAVSPDIVEAAGEDDPRATYDSRRRLQQLLAILTPEDRAMIILYEIEGWPVGELATMFKKPAGTIKTRLARARRKMRQTLERHLPKPQMTKTDDEGIYALPRCKTTD
ncbi:RNA polymerase sigma factor [Candidatus Zixiibacteriota bacterium]